MLDKMIHLLLIFDTYMISEIPQRKKFLHRVNVTHSYTHHATTIGVCTMYIKYLIQMCTLSKHTTAVIPFYGLIFLKENNDNSNNAKKKIHADVLCKFLKKKKQKISCHKNRTRNTHIQVLRRGEKMRWKIMQLLLILIYHV